MTWTLIGSNAALVLGLMTALWVASVIKRDASIVDPWWSIAFLLITWNTALRTGATPGKVLLLVMVSIWALRLWSHLLSRSRGEDEDPRYQAFRARYGPQRYWWISFFQVFMLQGLLATLISAPLQLAAAAPSPDPIGVTDVLGLLLFTFGFLFESVADAQLQAFRDDPSRRGQILDTGLWSLTRHPNYFGEATLWWGFWLCALDQPWGWATALAPALMTFLLVRVSGARMMDEHMRRTKPKYVDYIRRTPAFIPRWRRGG